LLRGDLAGSNDLARRCCTARGESRSSLRVEAYYESKLFWRENSTQRAASCRRRSPDGIHAMPVNTALFRAGSRCRLWRAPVVRAVVFDRPTGLGMRWTRPSRWRAASNTRSVWLTSYFAAWMMNDCGDFDRGGIVEELAIHTIEHDLGILAQ
jgi:hypothetical protein